MEIRETLRNHNLVAVVASMAVFLGATGCGDSCAVGSDSDRDCDRIADRIDRYPDLEDANDVDGDGLPNYRDPFPYLVGLPKLTQGMSADPSTIPPNFQHQEPTTGGSTGSGIPCEPGYGTDSDGDLTPDHCDSYYLNEKDRDGDGILDSVDPCPDVVDCDYDGQWDGVDRNPQVDQQRLEDRRAQEKYEQERYEEKRQRERQEEERRREE